MGGHLRGGEWRLPEDGIVADGSRHDGDAVGRPSADTQSSLRRRHAVGRAVAGCGGGGGGGGGGGDEGGEGVGEGGVIPGASLWRRAYSVGSSECGFRSYD